MIGCFNNLQAGTSNKTSYGEYLQWLYAKEVNDIPKIKEKLTENLNSEVKEPFSAIVPEASDEEEANGIPGFSFTLAALTLLAAVFVRRD